MLYYEYLCNHDRKRVIYLNHYEDKENMNKQSGDDVPQHSRRRKKEEAKHRRPSRKEQFEMRRQEASSESVSGSAAASSSGKEKKEKKCLPILHCEETFLPCGSSFAKVSG